MNKVRNGEIDILRFVFAMTIVIYHFSTNYSTITWYRGGGVGVEFFFMLTGILMAKSAQNVVVTKEQIPRQLYSFLKRKIASFYPHYLSAIILQMVLFRWVLQHETIHLIINRIFCGIPDLLLVQVSGLMYDGGVEVGGAWFLSALVIALFILYPIQLYYNEQATLYIFPIIGVMGLVVGMNSGLFDFGTYYIYYFSRIIRALSGIALGAWGFGLATMIDSFRLTKLSKILLTALKIGCFVMAIGYCSFTLPGSYGALATIFCFWGIVLSFSQSTICIPGNALTTLLGRISLPLYLTHNLVRAIVLEVCGIDIDFSSVVVIIGICPIVAWFVMVITDFIMKQLRKIRSLFVDEQSV